MLILTRRVGEKVVVGDDIVISIVDVRGDSVRIGIEAPKSVSVHRQEVWVALQAANSAAAASTDDAVNAVVESLAGSE